MAFAVCSRSAKRDVGETVWLGPESPAASTLKSSQPDVWNCQKLYVGFSCLAMADTQAVKIVQTCHLGLCFEGVTQESILIAMNLPAPQGKLGCGVVIDDFVPFSNAKHDFPNVGRGRRGQRYLQTRQRQPRPEGASFKLRDFQFTARSGAA